MKASIESLGHILYAPSQFVIPVFQRNYRWELPQWEKYWTSLLEIQQPTKRGNHFMGFLVFVAGGIAQPGQNTRFHMIDGQQRLTTTSLLLAAIRNVAKRMEDNELAQEVNDYYLVHPLKKGENRYRLLPKAQDATSYTAIIDGKPAAPGRMLDALAWFDAKVSEKAAKDVGKLRALFETVCQRLEFMCATLESENAYSVFKGLNSTGVPLGQADLIRNFIFMHVHPDVHDEFDQDVWAPLEAQFTDAMGKPDEALLSRYMRDVLMSEGQYVQPSDTFAVFEGRYEATGFDPTELGAQLLRWAKYFAVIVGRAGDTDPGVTQSLAELNKLESATTTPLLLALFRQRDAGAINAGQLAHAIEMLRGFILRRFIAGENSRGYGQVFVRAIDPRAAQPIETLENYLLDRGWPHDAQFIESFSLLPLYKRGYAREVLETLERARGHKEMPDLTGAQIEHILPQTITKAWADELGDEPERVHAEWLHRPGNLTLSAYNQELGNQPFSAKRARFKSSNIELTKEVSTVERWTDQEILMRGQRMATAAAAIWTGPKEPYVVQQPKAMSEDANIARLAFWTGFAKYLAHAYPELPEIEPGTERCIRLKTGIPKLVLEVRYRIVEDLVAIDLHFHEKAFKLWSRFKQEPESANAAIGETWTFGRSKKRVYGWMSVERAAPSSDPAYWPGLQAWLAQKLAQVHQQCLPMLRFEWEKASSSGVDEEPESTQLGLPPITLQQQRFWAVLAGELAQRSQTLRSQKPQPQNWTYVAIGRTGITIAPTLNTRDMRLGVELSIGSLDAKLHYHALLEQRKAIEAEFGMPLDWQELPAKHMSRIAVWRINCDLRVESRWPEYADWMIDMILRMEAAFRHRVGALP